MPARPSSIVDTANGFGQEQIWMSDFDVCRAGARVDLYANSFGSGFVGVGLAAREPCCRPCEYRAEALRCLGGVSSERSGPTVR